MKTNHPSINEVIENPELLNHDGCWSFYDWFCVTETLERRARSFIPKLKFLVKEGIINGDTTYVWFKNNCPLIGSVYDDMRFSLLDEDNSYLGGVCPSLGYTNTKGEATVWTLKNGLEEHEFNNWSELKKSIKQDKDFKDELTSKFKGNQS